MMFRFITSLSLLASAAFAAPADDAKSILATTKVHGGIIVQLGIGDGKLTAALKQNEGTLVHGLDHDQAKVDASREWMRATGIYGQVAVEKLTTPVLPYLDGMINLIVVENKLGLADDELMRVLAPNGSVVTHVGSEWKTTTKPMDTRMDDWTHYLHGPGGNPVSQDTAVGPPENLQWVGSPRWSRHHDRMSSISGMVSQGGRIFYIMDMGSRISIMLPPKWQLIARDGYNGMILWTKEIPDWQNHMWPLKSGPTQLTRRLVAVDDKIYVTLGRATHVTCLSAFDGSVIKEYPEAKFAEEILVEGKQMLVQARHTDDDERTTFTPSQGDQGRSNNGYFWDEKPRGVMLVDTESGKTIWNKEQIVAPLSLCMDDKHVVFHDGDKVVAWDRATGTKLWETEKAARKQQISANFGPRVLIYKSVVLFAGGEGHMTSYELATGKKLWQDEHPPSGYQSPQDLMVARGLVWCAGTTSGNLDGNFKGRDAVTGEVKFEIPPDVAKDTYWFHHRCYISKATENFIMPSRTGVEFVDLDKKSWDINHWVRGACLYGVMPANGLVYAPPHDCACYPETKLYGLNAMAPKITARVKPSLKDSDDGRLEKGPAFDDTFADAKEPSKGDWPTYRGSPGRTGFLQAEVGSNLSEGWTTKLGGKLSAISVGEGKVFVAQVEQHTLHALNQQTGAPEWHFTAGGRIDSPPSIWKGRVVFGCMDGWVYCLRAKDGAMVWRFRGAPKADRHMAFEGLESVWPVSGAVLMEGNVAQFIAGRSNFMDGGLRFLKVDVESGSKLVETSVDDKDPLTGGDFQDSHQVLQMPAGLADILVSDGKFTYLKSQKFNADGSRSEFGVNSANAIAHGADQQGEGAHVYAPMGFMDDSWFHRSYWVYGKNMAGGHNGYYQAGKFTPAGRILVVDDKNVYSYARKPQYYKWTTPLEHHLFSAPKEAPKVEPSQLAAALEGGNPRKQAKKGDKKGKADAKAAPVKTDSVVTVAHSDKLDPSNKPFTIEAWIRGELISGVIAVQGGNAQGYGLALNQGKPEFAIAINNKTTIVASPIGVDDTWHHIAGTVGEGGKMKLFVDGVVAAEGNAGSLMPKNPNLGFSIGDNNSSKLWPNLPSFTGWIDVVRVSFSELRPEDAKSLAQNPEDAPPANAKPALVIGFDQQNGEDSSPNKLETKAEPGLKYDLGAKGGYAVHISSEEAKTGTAASAAQKNGTKAPANGYFVEPHWAHEIPIIARGMALANNVLFVAGPDDVVDEEDALDRMTKGDISVEPSLKQQDELLDGKHGAVVVAVDATSGNVLSTTKLTSPPQWDGMSAAKGAVFVSQLDGSVVCLKGGK